MAMPSVGRSVSTVDSLPLILPTALFLLLAAVVWVGGWTNARAESDQNGYHLVAIRTFSGQFPRPDFHDYPSATTPGYHLVLAVAFRFVTEDALWLRAIGALFTVGLLISLGAQLRRRVSPLCATALTLPVATSLYTFTSGAWLLPDNAGWWGVLIALAIALSPCLAPRTYFYACVLTVALILTRQVHIWTAGLLVFAAWLGSSETWKAGHTTDSRLSARLRRATRMSIALLPAAAVGASFFALWHGTMPPSMKEEQSRGWSVPEAGIRLAGPNWAVPAAFLSIVGGIGLFYLPYVSATWKRSFSVRPVLFGAITGMLIGALPPTSYELGARSSGLWNAVRALPTVADRSPLVAGLASLGGAILAMWWQVLPRRDALVFSAAVVFFVAAQIPNPSAFQRYYEPFVLIIFALAAARVKEYNICELRTQQLTPAGPLILSILLTMITVASLR
jgi:hypothetical protein